ATGRSRKCEAWRSRFWVRASRGIVELKLWVGHAGVFAEASANSAAIFLGFRRHPGPRLRRKTMRHPQTHEVPKREHAGDGNDHWRVRPRDFLYHLLGHPP